MKRFLDQLKENIFSVSLVLIIFIALFSVKLIPIFIAIIFLLWILKFRSFQGFSSKRKWIWPFLFYAIVFGIAFFFSENPKDAVKILERHVSFLVLPLFIYCKEWKISDIQFFGKFYVWTILTIAFFSIFNLLYFYSTHVDFVAEMDDTYLQWKLPHLTGFHPTYYGFLIVIATIILLEDVINIKLILKSKSFYIAVFLSFYLLYISPRMAIICQCIVWAWFGYQRLFKYKFTKVNKVLLTVVIMFVFVLLLATSEYFFDKMAKALEDRRFSLWSPAYDIIQSNYFIFGEGLGNGKIYLNEYISKHRLSQFKGTDLHNQYLMNMVDLGVIGLIALLLILIRPLHYFKDRGIVLFIIVTSISMMSESFLYVIKGIVMFIVLSSYFIIRSQLMLVKNQD